MCVCIRKIHRVNGSVLDAAQGWEARRGLRENKLGEQHDQERGESV